MMTLEQLRAPLQAHLAAWQTTVQAFEAQLKLGRKEAIDRLEQQKQTFTMGLDHLESELQRSRGIVQSQRQTFIAAINNLKLQISLGRAESRDLFVAQQKLVHDAIARLDDEFNRHREAISDKLGAEYVRWVNSVKAEFDAASVHFSEMGARQSANWQGTRDAFEHNLEEIRKQLVAAQEQAIAQAGHIPEALSAGMQQLRDSFGDLFGGKDKPKT
jgi:hypothetical protein